MTHFYFLRHGETDFNLKGVWTGRTDVSLNAAGIDSVRLVIGLLQDVGIRKIYTSPLLRAYETSRAIALSLPVSIEVVEGLMERNFGRFEGKPKANIDVFELNNDPTVESELDLAERVKAAIDKLILDDTTLLVSHSWVYRALVGSLGYSSTSLKETIRNAELIRLNMPLRSEMTSAV